ncbi:MAG: hypothetical protein QM539_10895 [Alphaproteobacteria bacterium]|nr:hypothetical protein [Alphaproteobacteria bacterium]
MKTTGENNTTLITTAEIVVEKPIFQQYKDDNGDIDLIAVIKKHPEIKEIDRVHIKNICNDKN